ncbi:MAG: hypothetical protein R3Y55_03810 [Rikenellaceae bacterium]
MEFYTQENGHGIDLITVCDYCNENEVCEQTGPAPDHEAAKKYFQQSTGWVFDETPNKERAFCDEGCRDLFAGHYHTLDEHISRNDFANVVKVRVDKENEVFRVLTTVNPDSGQGIQLEEYDQSWEIPLQELWQALEERKFFSWLADFGDRKAGGVQLTDGLLEVEVNKHLFADTKKGLVLVDGKMDGERLKYLTDGDYVLFHVVLSPKPSQDIGEMCPRCGTENIIKDWTIAKGMCATCCACEEEFILCSQCPNSSGGIAGAGCSSCIQDVDAHATVRRDLKDMANFGRSLQSDGTTLYHFGDTSIRAKEIIVDGQYILVPKSGDQIAHGCWDDIDDSELNAYCQLLQLYLNLVAGGDEALEKAWQELGDVPMCPETEDMEEPFLHFPRFTRREEIWKWFDEHHTKGVAYLLYGGDPEPNVTSLSEWLSMPKGTVKQLVNLVKKLHRQESHFVAGYDIESTEGVYTLWERKCYRYFSWEALVESEMEQYEGDIPLDQDRTSWQERCEDYCRSELGKSIFKLPVGMYVQFMY